MRANFSVSFMKLQGVVINKCMEAGGGIGQCFFIKKNHRVLLG